MFHKDIAVKINNDIIKYSNNKSTTISDKKPTITVKRGAITFNGKGILNIMDGIEAVDIDGETDITDKISATIVTENSLDNKIVKYSVAGSNGNIGVNQRKISLIKYTGPSILLADSIIINADNLSDLVSVLINEGKIKAEDGFGNDITEQISYRYEVMDTTLNKYKITFTVNNYFADVRSQTIYKIIEGAIGPSIVLKSKTAVLKVGAVFNPFYYLQIAEDPQEGNLIDFVQIEGNVDTGKKGQYIVTYAVANSKKETAYAKLIVYIN